MNHSKTKYSYQIFTCKFSNKNITIRIDQQQVEKEKKRATHKLKWNIFCSNPKFNRLLRACVFAGMSSRRINNINTIFNHNMDLYVSESNENTLKNVNELHIKRDCENTL